MPIRYTTGLLRRLSLAMFLCFGPLAWSADLEALKACEKAGTTMEMGACGTAHLEVQKEILALTLAVDSGSGGAEGAERKQAAQRAWEAFRDSFCEFYSEYSWPDGSGASNWYQDCLITRTKLRIEDLALTSRSLEFSGKTVDAAEFKRMEGEYKRSDQALNDAYRSLFNSAEWRSPQLAQVLRKAQLAWIRYRDAACADQQQYSGSAPMCLARYTKIQTWVLDAEYEYGSH